MRARFLVAVAAALVAVLVPSAAPAGAQAAIATDVRGADVLVVGAPGLRWSDISPVTTPALWALAQRSAVGLLSVKALPAVSCPADGWLTLGAGKRARAFGVSCGELAVERDEQVARNRATRDAADVDALVDALAVNGRCLSARGPGAEAAGGTPVEPRPGANQGEGGGAGACDVLLLDAAVVGADGSARAAGAAAVDALVAAVDAARDDGSTLLVAGMAQAPTDDDAQLQVALANGPEFPAGSLVSASTGRVPYVQLIDVAPTVLDVLGIEVPTSMAGRPWQVSGGPLPSAALLADLADRAATAKQVTVPFVVVVIATGALGLGLARLRRSWAIAELSMLGVVAALGASYLAGVVTWWRFDVPLLALVLITAALAVPAAALARRARGLLAAAGACCGGVAVVLALDLLTGAPLQIDTPLGYSPLVAGRFAGIGNVAFGVFAAAVLLALAAIPGRGRRAAAAVAAAGVTAVVLDGAPLFGRDVGGVLALAPAVALLAMRRAGARVTAPRLALAGLAGVAVVVTFALLDALRPAAERTHLGRFVEQVRAGTAGEVIERKALAIADLLFANPVTALLPLVVAAAVLAVVRPPRRLRAVFEAAPAWRDGLLAVGVASAVGFVVNDSGPAIPALALLVAGPATLAVVARRAVREDVEG